MNIHNSLSDIIKPGDKWLSVSQGTSGYFAVLMWLNNEDTNCIFPEPYDTGFSRYATYAEAKDDAIGWAAAENLPFTE